MERFGVLRADGSRSASPAFAFPRNSGPIRSQTRLARKARGERCRFDRPM